MSKFFLIIIFVCCSLLMAEHSNRSSNDVKRVESANEVIFAVKSNTALRANDVNSLNAVLPKSLRPYDAQSTKPLFTYRDQDGSMITIFEHRVENRSTVKAAVSALTSSSSVKWASPNYSYEGDPREDITTTNDPKTGEQYHHPVMKNPEAWKISQGSVTVVVAVTDDGVDIDHVDLKNRMWKNTKEIPNNNIDDDGNGYVDDFDGWDFSSDDNDPRPNGGSHGTHVAGIVVAERNNKTGISGTAPGVNVMPIRFYGSGSWTSSIVAKSYAYAVDNGAKIITTSFNINGFVGDPVYEASLKYLYQNGVLLFNSGGNGSQANPKRQAFHEVLLVASTIADEESDDEKSSYSNWGIGMDISAPGGGGKAGILSTIPGNGYGRKSGTSMASPNAAAVAAMIWSVHPEWTREQVVAQLFRSCDSVDEVNKKYKDLLGPGRVNTYNAIHQPTLAPRIRGLRELSNKTIPILKNVTKLTVAVVDLLDRNKAENTSNWKLENLDNGKEVTLHLDADYLIGSNEVVFSFDKLSAGNYRFIGVAEKLQDPFGTSLEEDFVVDFSVNE
ncbi:S8 family serine peptidase [Candidatus Uabimicrobium sp. HlEnr_7]|uniref:S8 family serine peptidase n=1 Tax=Candidatus Uabimicrobium helgolandensis TaxID=3095367 RepID=UPI0035566FFA